MIKYIKWFLLIILIIALIIIGIKIVDYDKDKFDISIIYNKDWYKRGVAVYENDELFSENQSLNGIYYMIFMEDNVSYCNSMTKECVVYSYEYKNGKVTINSDDDFIPKGTYDIKYEDDVLELSIKDKINTIVYYLRSPVG